MGDLGLFLALVVFVLRIGGEIEEGVDNGRRYGGTAFAAGGEDMG